MVIYELVTLQTPFDNLSPFKVSECIINGERPGLPRLPAKYASSSVCLVATGMHGFAVLPKCDPLTPHSRALTWLRSSLLLDGARSIFADTNRFWCCIASVPSTTRTHVPLSFNSGSLSLTVSCQCASLARRRSSTAEQHRKHNRLRMERERENNAHHQRDPSKQRASTTQPAHTQKEQTETNLVAMHLANHCVFKTIRRASRK
jgi:hypothetical protein